MPEWARKRRDANEAEIVTALERVGATVERLHVPLDLLVGYRGITYLLEVKTPTGELTDEQRKWMASWRGHAAVVRTPRDALREIRAI